MEKCKLTIVNRERKQCLINALRLKLQRELICLADAMATSYENHTLNGMSYHYNDLWLATGTDTMLRNNQIMIVC